MAMWKVPVIGQITPKLCWEACARMMWLWRYKSINGYAWNHVDQGKTPDEMDKFYTFLGMQSLPNPQGVNLRHALNWTPAIFMDADPQIGHAMVLTGYDRGTYFVNNPCAVQELDENGAGVCGPGQQQKTVDEVEGRHLGRFMWYW